MNANMYYGNDNNQNIERGLGYNYNNNNPTNNNPPNNNQNYYNITPNQYPQTGINIADADNTQNNRIEFFLPEHVKLGMILSAICCFLCFFIVLLVK